MLGCYKLIVFDYGLHYYTLQAGYLVDLGSFQKQFSLTEN